MQDKCLKYQRLVTAERDLVPIAQPCIDPSSYTVVHSQTNSNQLLLICAERNFELPVLLFDLSKFSQEYFFIRDPDHLYPQGINVIEQKVLFFAKALYLFVLCVDYTVSSTSLLIFVI